MTSSLSLYDDVGWRQTKAICRQKGHKNGANTGYPGLDKLDLEPVLFHLVPQIPLIEANDGVSRQFFGLKVTQSGLKCISIGYNILFYIWEL